MLKMFELGKRLVDVIFLKYKCVHYSRHSVHSYYIYIYTVKLLASSENSKLFKFEYRNQKQAIMFWVAKYLRCKHTRQNIKFNIFLLKNKTCKSRRKRREKRMRKKALKSGKIQ